jgi:catechol 2,3-dioxygenase-like lactoylglutathione lyase family enzyme
MFKDSRAFSSFSVKDVKRAREFYGSALGLDLKELPEGLELAIAGGGRVFLYPKPSHQPATYTVLNFPVPSIEEAVRALEKKGVRFEHYDLPGMKTDERGIFRGGPAPMAWFSDPDGNILSVMESRA